VNRRTFLSSAAYALNVTAAPSIPIIDTHIHLFDVSRPQGVPWPPKDSKIYQSALPDRYRKVAAPFGIVGAIEIECSPWPDDNEWVLGVAERAPIIVGTIGNLEPGTPGFGKHLERLHGNPLFRGLRCGNLWGRDLGAEISRPECVADLKLLASAGLVMDTANPTPSLMRSIVRLSDLVPDLTIVLDHLPGLTVPSDAAAGKACEDDLRTLAGRSRVFAKISGIVRGVGERVPLDLNFYRDRLNHIWELFGPDRLMYGSDWPNGEQWASYPDVFRLAHEFISTKEPLAIEKFYWRNSLAVYRWVKRDANQPAL
jgi:L-fuconolactonase